MRRNFNNIINNKKNSKCENKSNFRMNEMPRSWMPVITGLVSCLGKLTYPHGHVYFVVGIGKILHPASSMSYYSLVYQL